MKKTLIKIMMVVGTVVLPVLAVSVVSGCSSPDQLNPYALAAGVNSIDTTEFFDDVYNAFLSLGASAADTTDTTSSSTSTSTTTSTTDTTDLSGMLGL